MTKPFLKNDWQAVSHTENQKLGFFLNFKKLHKITKFDHRRPQITAENVTKTHSNRLSYLNGTYLLIH